MLINGYKFDLRIYVLVTSYNPLRIYLYEDGLARFCAEKFSLDDDNLDNRFAHLTNYSINKFSERFKVCEDSEEVGQGSKSLISHLKPHLKESNYQFVFDRIEDIVIKTIISAEQHIFKSLQSSVKYRDTCFEILGFDILLDSFLNPWLLEVNTSPSFATESKLDFELKSKILTEAFNIVGINKETEEDKVRRYKVNSKLESFLSMAATKLRKKQQDKKDQAKTKRDYLLQELREEVSRTNNFKLIFPAMTVDRYTKYFEEDRPNNRTLRNVILKRSQALD